MLLPKALVTSRLVLRPFAVGDAGRFYEIQSDWRVMRNLRAATWPATIESLVGWLEGAQGEWLEGTAFRFTILLANRVIGCADVDEIREGHGDLGYWLEPDAWGQGLATEAATAVRDFALVEIGLSCLNSGHAEGNDASGNVLTKLGFRLCGETKLWSNPRQTEIRQIQYRLDGAA